MTIHLIDKSSVSVRHLDTHETKLTFHGLGNLVMCLPVGVDVSVNLLQRLYDMLRTQRPIPVH